MTISEDDIKSFLGSKLRQLEESGEIFDCVADFVFFNIKENKENMSDTFKKVHTEMPEETKKSIFDMKSKAEELKECYDKVNNREMSIAQTNLEQAMMWATKAYVLEGDKINAKNKK